METKELKITIPEGYEIDKEKSTFEKIVFEKKDTKPRSWEEYCKQQVTSDKEGYYISDVDCMITKASWNLCSKYNNWRTVLPTKELAEAFLAMMQLMSVRQTWIGDWQPDWKDDVSKKWCIVFLEDKLKVDFFVYNALPLSFPSKEMATDFMNCFKDLLNIAKPLI